MTASKGIRPTPRQRLERRIKVDFLTEDGWSIKRIAAHLGVCRATVCNDRGYIKRMKSLRRLETAPWYRLGDVRVDIAPTPYVQKLKAEASRVDVWEELGWPEDHKPSKVEVVDIRDHLYSRGMGPERIGRLLDSWGIKPPQARKWGISSVYRMDRGYAERLERAEQLCRRMVRKGLWWGRMARILTRLGVPTPLQQKTVWRPDNVKKFCVRRGIQLRPDAMSRFYRAKRHRCEVDHARGCGVSSYGLERDERGRFLPLREEAG